LEAEQGESSAKPDGLPGESVQGFDGAHGESQGIADLLSESGDAKTPEGESQNKPARLIDQAEKLGLKPEDLYKLTVAFDNGKSLTVGELKDIAAKHTDYEASSLALESRRQEQESKFTRMHGELRELVAALPESARNSKALAAAAQRFEARVTEARAETDAAIDGWKDNAERRTADKAAMGKFLAEYGFEAGYLDTVLDPRTVRFVHDAWKLSDRVKGVLAKVKRAAPDKKPASSKPGQVTAPKNGTDPTATVSKRYAALLD
jgi:hypothetical protein